MEPLEILVRKIQARCFGEGIRIQEFFRDHDPLRKGFCTMARVIIY